MRWLSVCDLVFCHCKVPVVMLCCAALCAFVLWVFLSEELQTRSGLARRRALQRCIQGEGEKHIADFLVACCHMRLHDECRAMK